MEAKVFYCYQSLNGSNQTVGIRNLDYREPYTLTDVFYEIKNAKDENDLLSRFVMIIKGDITLGQIKENTVSYHIATEKLGNVIMRIRLKKGTEDESL